MGQYFGKISVIKKDVTAAGIQTMNKSLLANGYTRTPGTGVTKVPYKELDGRYRTGLDPKAAYIDRIIDNQERELERNRVQKMLEELQVALGSEIDLSPRSKFWNYASDAEVKISPCKLTDGDNIFDFKDPMKKITFCWLAVHPTIARSWQSWERGEYPSDTQFFVANEDIESEITYKKKQSINRAIVQFEEMTIDKKRKVARLLGLPISDSTPEKTVYNMVDSKLKDLEFKTGQYEGLSTVEVFNGLSQMSETLLNVKDLVKQGIQHSIYRVKQGGRIYEGELKIADSEEDLVEYLTQDINQEDLLALDKKLNIKKLSMFK
jgi:hypothetical protein